MNDRSTLHRSVYIVQERMLQTLIFKTEVNISVVYMAAVFHTAVYSNKFSAALNFTAVYIAAVHLT